MCAGRACDWGRRSLWAVVPTRTRDGVVVGSQPRCAVQRAVAGLGGKQPCVAQPHLVTVVASRAGVACLAAGVRVCTLGAGRGVDSGAAALVSTRTRDALACSAGRFALLLIRRCTVKEGAALVACGRPNRRAVRGAAACLLAPSLAHGKLARGQVYKVVFVAAQQFALQDTRRERARAVVAHAAKWHVGAGRTRRWCGGCLLAVVARRAVEALAGEVRPHLGLVRAGWAWVLKVGLGSREAVKALHAVIGW